MKRLDRHSASCLLAWAIVSALYIWVAAGVSSGDGDRRNVWHHYDYLVDGFLSGHLHLSITPPKELLALPDPRDPVQNNPYRLEDVSLYNGEYYLYFGPTPALLLMLPWRVLTGHHLPLWLATGLFAVAGMAGLSLLLAGLRRRYFPAVTPRRLFWTVVLVGHVNWLLVVLQHPAVWELPIVTAVALFWWSLFFLWRYHESGGRIGWAAAAGVTLALLLGARPTYVFTTGVLALFFALPIARATPLTVYLRRLFPVGLPLAMGVGGLLAYNYFRFGNVFEFGQHYQLNADDWRGTAFFGSRFLPFNLQLYLLSFPEVSPYFPFLHPGWPAHLPHGYTNVEDVYGLLIATPATLLGLVGLVYGFRHRTAPDRQPVVRLLFATTAAGALQTGLLCCFAGAGSRYEPEILAGWIAVTAVGCMTAFDNNSPIQCPRYFRRLLVALSIWSVLVVWLATGRGFSQMAHSRVRQMIVELFDYPSWWIARSTYQSYGPVALDVRLPAQPATGATVLMATGYPSMSNQLMIDRPAPDQVRFRLIVNNLVLAETPVLRQKDATIHVICSAPWLYPPAAHPYWRATYPDPAERRRRQTLYAIGIDGTVYSRQSWWGFDATRFEPNIRTAAFEPPACAWVESLSCVDPGSMPVNSPVSPVPGPKH